MKLTADQLYIPINIDPQYRNLFHDNLLKITEETGKLFMFAGDQKIEHLNDDFWGPNISREDSNPEHIFRIASLARISALATQYGLITHYGADYPDIPYIVKINSKTNFIPTEQRDPISTSLIEIDKIVELRDKYKLNIVGIGYTIYPGSEYEHVMHQTISKMIAEAHHFGLFSVIWSYPRGKAVANSTDPHVIAGAAGLAACLGADFVKVNLSKNVKNHTEELQEAIQAAGRTGLITAGGSSKPVEEFLHETYQINQAGASGAAVGRNIHQKSLQDAVKFCDSIASILFDGQTAQDAYSTYLNQ